MPGCGGTQTPSELSDIESYIDGQFIALGLKGCDCTDTLIAPYSMDSSALHAAFVVLKAQSPPQQAFAGSSSFSTSFAVTPTVATKQVLMVVRDDVPQILNTNYTLTAQSGSPTGPYDTVTLILKDGSMTPGLAVGETLDFYLIVPGVFMPIRYAGDLMIGDSDGSPSRLVISTTNGDVLTNVDGAPAWAASSGLRAGVGTLVDGVCTIADALIGSSSVVEILWDIEGLYMTPIHELKSARINGTSFRVVSS